MNIVRFFSLVDTKAKMTLKAEASTLYLSYLWWILEPILFVLAYYFVFDILLDSGRKDFLFFLMCGKIPYLWFSKSVITASNSIVANQGLINQAHMPKALFPYTAIQIALYKEWVVYFILIGVALFYGYFPSWNWLWLMPLIVIQYLLIIVCSLVGAVMVCFVGDFRMVINMGLLFILFVSGVFFDISSINNPTMRDALLAWNPLAFLIDGYRQVLMLGRVYDTHHMVKLATTLVVLAVLIHVAYVKFSRAIAARVINS